MDDAERRDRMEETLDGYDHGPGAPMRATVRALAKIDAAHSVVLVEGISDQIAVETAAGRLDRDLDAEGVVVVPIGGAQAAARYLRQFGPHGERMQVAGLYDADATGVFLQALRTAGVGLPETTADLADLGFHVCVRDLEDELIRAAGIERVLDVLRQEAELRAFSTFQKQPEWRGRPVGQQLRRFIASKSRRSSRYARLLVEVVDIDRLPAPLDSVLSDV